MASWGITSESQVRAQAAYDRKNTVRLSLKLNVRTDKDIIQWIRLQKSMQGAIKRLIREEIARADCILPYCLYLVVFNSLRQHIYLPCLAQNYLIPFSSEH